MSCSPEDYGKVDDEIIELEIRRIVLKNVPPEDAEKSDQLSKDLTRLVMYSRTGLDERQGAE